jgi:hypothetical protein
VAVRRLTAAALALAALLAGCESQPVTKGPPADQPSEAQVKLAVAADLGVGNEGQATLKAMAADKPDLGLFVGDLGEGGADVTPKFCQAANQAFGTTPAEFIPGEEDLRAKGNLDAYIRCLPDKIGVSSGRYARQYALDFGRLARLIMISPGLEIGAGHYYFYGKDDDGKDTPEFAWLKKEIDEAHQLNYRWVVVAMHKNCISMGAYYCDVFQELFSTLLDKKVDLVVSGHDHTYQRSKQIASGRPGCKVVRIDDYDPDCVVDAAAKVKKGAGTVFVIDGAVKTLYDLNPKDSEAKYFAASMGRNSPGKRRGFLQLTLSTSALDGRFVGATPGKFTDQFSIG